MSYCEMGYKWRVSEKFWKDKGLTEEQYKQVILGCPNKSPGFCESCMGDNTCEIRVLGFEVWHNKYFPDKPLPISTKPIEVTKKNGN